MIILHTDFVRDSQDISSKTILICNHIIVEHCINIRYKVSFSEYPEIGDDQMNPS